MLAVLIGFALLPSTLLGQNGTPDGTELTIPAADRILTLATFWSEAKYNRSCSLGSRALSNRG